MRYERWRAPSAFSASDHRALGTSPSWQPDDFIHSFFPAPSSFRVNLRIFNPEENGLLGEQWFGRMRENDSLMKYNLWMDGCRKACQELLAVTLHSLPLLVFIQRERKTKISTEDKEMNVFGTEERKWVSETVWSFLGKGTVTAVGSQTWSPVLPCFLRRHARPALVPSQDPNQASLPGLMRCCRVSRRELFWVKSILACLPVCTTECNPDRRGMGAEIPCPRHNWQKSFPLGNDPHSSHRPPH